MAPFRKRVTRGKRLEPSGDQVFHGAGQCLDEFIRYSAVLNERAPIIYMAYRGLRGITSEWFSEVTAKYEGAAQKNLCMQLGLSMTQDGAPWLHYEHEVAAGLHDKHIETLCEGLSSIDRPVYLRLGYEFNGEWNGYEPRSFIAAWKRIWHAIRRHSLDNVALVWCYSPDAKVTADHMPFYPGDACVDWWSIDLFSDWHFTSPRTERFLADAAKREFPVMIGETTPRYIGVCGGMQSWRSWYMPFFNLIRVTPVIKAFCYINWNWARYPMWSDWGECRIDQNELVMRRYREELANLWYACAP